MDGELSIRWQASSHKSGAALKNGAVPVGDSALSSGAAPDLWELACQRRGQHWQHKKSAMKALFDSHVQAGTGYA
jgi:hypothetical protein